MRQFGCRRPLVPALRAPLLLPALGPLPSSLSSASWTGLLSSRASPSVRKPSVRRLRIHTVSIDGDSPPDRDARDADAALHDDAEDLAGDDEEVRDDDAAVAGGADTPVWPTVDATLAQLEDWLESLRRLPKDDAILARQSLLSRRISELRTPLPASRASPLTLVLKARRVTDKHRKQLQRFIAMREGLLAEERALQATIADAHATIAATGRLLTMAEKGEYERFCAYASSRDAPGRVPSPEAAGSARAAAASRAIQDPVVAAGASGLTTQLLMLPIAAETSNLGAAYAAVLEQARLVHKELTGDMGPTLEPAPPPAGHVDAGEGGVAPRMAWVAGDADRGPTGMSVPPLSPQLAPMWPFRLPPAPWGLLCPTVAMPALSWVVVPPRLLRLPAMKHVPGQPPGVWSGRALRRCSRPLALAGRIVSAPRGALR